MNLYDFLVIINYLLFYIIYKLFKYDFLIKLVIDICSINITL